MVNGSHVIFYAKDADKVRSFFSDVSKLGSVDAGHGWLIFALPPAEFAVHPTEGAPRYELYLMCDDIEATTKDLQAKGVEFVRPVKEERWGSSHRDQAPRRRRNGPLRAAPSDRPEAEIAEIRRGGKKFHAHCHSALHEIAQAATIVFRETRDPRSSHTCRSGSPFTGA